MVWAICRVPMQARESMVQVTHPGEIKASSSKRQMQGEASRKEGRHQRQRQSKAKMASWGYLGQGNNIRVRRTGTRLRCVCLTCAPQAVRRIAMGRAILSKANKTIYKPLLKTPR